ncbi:MAG: UDP-N-acetylmuramate--L-alanine ligase [Candidatus Anammoxibacter sp.]
MANYYFTGIGGIGMSSLAQILSAQGHNISGSDRNYDRDQNLTLFDQLMIQGIRLLPQDGSGINSSLTNVIVSSAIEDDNPEIKKAKESNIPIMKRADLLANIFNNKFGIAIGGSNGKTSVTAMTGWILDYAGLDPTIMNGGYIKNFVTNTNPGNARAGQSDIMVIEADESDGSIVGYKPKISVLTSISKDHKTIEELFELFDVFANNTNDKLVANADCPNVSKLVSGKKNIVTYGIKQKADIVAVDVIAKDIKFHSWGSTFKVDNDIFHLHLLGQFNISNALAAISVTRNLDVPVKKIIEALNDFKGVGCRMDIVGTHENIKVINDYAHNPEKIMAAIDALRFDNKRLVVIYQPHGYGPTRFLKNELIMALKTKLLESDVLIMPEIYYAGGTAKKDISSKDIVDELKNGRINASYFTDRSEIIGYLETIVEEDDTILVLGARDNTLADFCREILEMLETR